MANSNEESSSVGVRGPSESCESIESERELPRTAVTSGERFILAWICAREGMRAMALREVGVACERRTWDGERSDMVRECEGVLGELDVDLDAKSRADMRGLRPWPSPAIWAKVASMVSTGEGSAERVVRMVTSL
jgi:hypothetical protein